MAEGLLLSSASRSAVVASGRPCSVLQGEEQLASLKSVKVATLLPQAQRQRRKYLLESEQEESEEQKQQHDQVINFWSSHLTKSHVAASALLPEPPEYFISHVWQPGDQVVNIEDFAEEKATTLKAWAVATKALFGEERVMRPPWFLLDTEEQQMAMMDPHNSWQNMRCWVDKACAHQGFNGGAPPQEALRATKAALVNCQHFVALISHPGYFRRLWCCVEWAFFLSRVAPNYRDLEILLPETLQQPANWSQLVHAAAAFRLEDLRCMGDAFGAELQRELQQLAVDQQGFEGFMRASALALLTLQALLQQGEGCAAFGNAAFLEAAVEACEACGLRGLGKVLATAQPMLWWRSAYRQVQRQYKERHHSATDVEDETRKTSKEGQDLINDPLEMLVRYVNKKWFQGQNTQAEPETSDAAKADENAAFSEEGEEEESAEEDLVVEPDAAAPKPENGEAPETVSLTLASLAQTAEVLLKQGGEAAAAKLPSDAEEDQSDQLELGDVEEEKAPVRQVPQCSSREAGAYAVRACEASAMKIAKAAKLEHDFMDDMASWHVNFMRKERTERLPSIVEDHEDEIPAGHAQEEGLREKDVRTEAESTAWRKILARSGAGLPDGYLDFWSSVYGEKLDVEAKVHARLFYQSWSIYHHRVCKWFDTYVVPFLEVWRQRGIRLGGIFEEAFSDAFLQVGGSIHDDMCKQLVVPHQGVEASASESGRTEIWDVPCLQRLLAIQRKEVTFVKGTDQDRSMLPAILVSPLPLQLGKEPNSAVLCARPTAGDWRRACVSQTLGATGLRNGVYQLLTNFASEGCTDGGLEIEVIMPRLLLQVRGADCEVVCGMRAQGFLEEKDENFMDQTGHSWQVEPKALEEVSGTEDENPSGSASSAPDTMVESHIDWSPWVFRAPPDEADESSPRRHGAGVVLGPPKIKAGHGPKALIDLRFIEHGVVGASLRPRKWWQEPTGAAERLLPAGVQGLPQKLPLISQQRFWHPETDLERGLSRAWKEWRSRPSETGPRMIADMHKAQSKSSWKQAFEMLPKSARAKMLKSAECYKLKDSQWLWRCLVEGGPSTPDLPPVMEERRGSLQEQFDRLCKQLESTCFLEWVALGDCSERQGRPLTTGKYVGGGGALLPPPVVTGGVPKVTAAEGAAGRPHVPADPLDASSPCQRCHQRALALVSLKGSTLSYVWGVEACVLCLRCGFSSTDSSLCARLLEEETVLEVTTSFLLRPGDGDLLQRSLARVLRVENNCCCVAMSQVAGRAESRVATLSFSLSTVTTAAAATVISRSSLLDTREQRYRPFASDQNWITLGLADTGLDLHFDRMRIYSVELAIQELDDKRMLRIRQEVSPLVMWLELVYLLSPDFSLIQWNRALSKVFGIVTLTAAVLMRMNINRLRQVVGAGPIPMEEPGSRPLTPQGVSMWPVSLHRVVTVKTSAYEETLGVAMTGAGLMDGGLKALRQLGHERQMEHFAGVDDQFQQELAAGKQDVEKTSVSTAMAILAKTRSSVGTNSRALLQARRILKRKQVFFFLRDLYTNIVSTDHKEPEWLRESADAEPEAHEASEDGSSNSNDEEIVLDEDDEDLQIHAPREVRERLDDAHKPQGLTIIKVLGHFSEYVHFSQMALMCIQVLGVMIRAAIRVKNNANSIAMRHDNGPKRTSNIEQAMLTNGFVASALKALYRHPTDPAICRETLLLLIYLATEDAAHNEHVQAKMQLLEPPERPFTLLLTISKLSSLDDRSNLLLCLQVFIAIATFPVPIVDAPKPAPTSPTARRPSRRSSRRYSKSQPQVRIGVRLAPMREAEAAQILVAVLGAHWRDKAVFTLVLRIVLISCDQPQLCRRFFEAGLSSQLRSFLRKVGRGEVLEFWFEEVKERTGMKSAKSLRKAKEAVLARQRVANVITEAENSCWQMLQVLAMNAGGGPEKAEQAHENYQHDSSKSIGQAIHELREATHNSQWSLAVKFLEAMLLYDFDAHAEFFHTQDGLTLALAELPNGQVAQIYPLLVAVLRLHVRSIPVSPYYSPVADDKVEALQRGDSFPRLMDLESKPMFPRLKHLDKRISAPELTVEGEYLMLSDRLTNAAKTVFAENAAARVLLESLMETKDLDLQDGLLRILSDLLQDKGLGAETAALEFKDFLLTDNGGSEVVLELMKGNLKNKGRVASALYALAGVVTLIPDSAMMMATELGCKVLIHTVWKYWMDGDIRRRSLMLLRRMRDAVPDLTAFMLKHWRANLSAMQNGELKDPDATSSEEEVTVVPTVVEEAPVTEVQETHEDDQGEGIEGPEAAPLQDHVDVMNEESPKLTQLDEETLDEEALKNSTEGRPESSFSRHSSRGDGTSPPPTQVATAPAPSAPVTEVRVPREMRHFFALLKVHRFEQKSSILAVPDVVQAIVDFKDDTELSRLGMRALMSGTAMEQEMRLPTIGRCPNFVKSVRRIMQKESMQDVIQLQLRLVLGILDNDPSDYQDWVECAVFAVSKVLQATMVWTTNSWEVVLQAISEAIRTPQGKILLQNFNVALSLYKAWEKLKDARDDALAKMIISSFLDQTERIMEMIG